MNHENIHFRNRNESAPSSGSSPPARTKTHSADFQKPTTRTSAGQEGTREKSEQIRFAPNPTRNIPHNPAAPVALTTGSVHREHLNRKIARTAPKRATPKVPFPFMRLFAATAHPGLFDLIHLNRLGFDRIQPAPLYLTIRQHHPFVKPRIPNPPKRFHLVGLGRIRFDSMPTSPKLNRRLRRYSQINGLRRGICVHLRNLRSFTGRFPKNPFKMVGFTLNHFDSMPLLTRTEPQITQISADKKPPERYLRSSAISRYSPNFPVSTFRSPVSNDPLNHAAPAPAAGLPPMSGPKPDPRQSAPCGGAIRRASNREQAAPRLPARCYPKDLPQAEDVRERV